MKQVTVLIKEIKDISEFNQIASRMPFDVDVVAKMPFDIVANDRQYCISAKSLMGLYSLDLSQPITIQCDATDEEMTLFAKQIEKFII